jgi:hypothetical protein
LYQESAGKDYASFGAATYLDRARRKMKAVSTNYYERAIVESIEHLVQATVHGGAIRIEFQDPNGHWWYWKTIQTPQGPVTVKQYVTPQGIDLM